jgi:SWI/SNF related-matrix-associated actin-dependent regulator of chromatin subfamily C
VGNVPAARPQGQLPPGIPSTELRTSIYQTTTKSSKELTPTEAAALAASVNAASAGGNGTAYTCDTCGVDCTRERYHSLKQRDYELCPPCYLDGRFPSTMYSGDFVRLTTAHSGINGVEPDKINGNTAAEGVVPKEEDDWTDAEVLLLLEGIEMYDDDWVAVSEHVGTRSREACIVKFLQLPIDEGYHDLEAGGVPGATAAGTNDARSANGLIREGDLGILRFGKIPFEKSDNPVLSVVAFLAGVKGLENIGVQEAGKDVTEMKKEAEDIVMEGTGAEGTSTNGEAKTTTFVRASATPAPASGSDGNLRATLHLPQAQRAASLALSRTTQSASTLLTQTNTALASTLQKLVKIQLEKLELKMEAFEEMEELLEDERKAAEAVRVGLAGERISLRKTFERVIEASRMQGGAQMAMQMGAQALTQGTGQMSMPVEVDPAIAAAAGLGVGVGEPGGPIYDGNVASLV